MRLEISIGLADLRHDTLQFHPAIGLETSRKNIDAGRSRALYPCASAVGDQRLHVRDELLLVTLMRGWIGIIAHVFACPSSGA